MRKWLLELVQDTNPLLIRVKLTLRESERDIEKLIGKKGRKGTYKCLTVTVTE